MITHDLRYGWRQMLRRPGISVAAILTLGLGIGANMTMYSWVDGRHAAATPRRRSHRPPRRAECRLKTRADLGTSYPNFVDFRERRPDSIEDLIAYSLAPMNMRTTATRSACSANW